MQQHSSKTAYVYSDKLLQYRFHDQHPFNQMRLKLTTELLLKDRFVSRTVQPRIATGDELMLIHKYDYVEAIKHASHGIISEDEAKNNGSNDEENGQFKHMHRHSATIVRCLRFSRSYYVRQVLNGCHLEGGGLHHV
ncbi:hypothetical protein ACVXZ0_10250 [Staphylococcus aureus]